MTSSFMTSPSYLFTSESVTEGHPDKLCDQISDAVLDALLAKDPYARVACETCVTNGLVVVMGEITTDAYVDIPATVREAIRAAGYTKVEYGIEGRTCGVMVSIQEQSKDIDLGVSRSREAGVKQPSLASASVTSSRASSRCAAISLGRGERPSEADSTASAVEIRACSSWIRRGGRTVQPKSRKCLLISPRTVGTQ